MHEPVEGRRGEGGKFEQGERREGRPGKRRAARNLSCGWMVREYIDGWGTIRRIGTSLIWLPVSQRHSTGKREARRQRDISADWRKAPVGWHLTGRHFLPPFPCGG